MSRVAYPLRALGYAQGSRRPWVAEIKGRDEQYEFARKFLRPHVTYDHKDRPSELWFTLRVGCLYEAHRHVKGAKTERVFLRAGADGTVTEIGRAELEREIDRRATELRRPLPVDVYAAARHRVAWVFDQFPRVSVSFSGGKDSTVLLHLAAEEARRRRRKIGLLFVDWEAQFSATVAHVEKMFAEYADCVEPYWVALPLTTVNACSQIEPEWVCWDARKRSLWVRQPPAGALTEESHKFPFYRPRMTFEEFAPAFGRWYAGDAPTCHLVGLRAAESLNRFRALVMRGKAKFEGRPWTTWLGGPAWNAYPLYDWHAADIWTYTARENKAYNPVYDLMHRAGLTPHQMRIDEPFGDETRRALWLYHVLEPGTWARMVARVGGAGTGALYCTERGSVLGTGALTKPDHLTWKAFADLLLETMPPPTAAHYRGKIAVWQGWYASNMSIYPEKFADELPGDLSGRDQPSWRRVCKVLLANDYWCKGLGFSPTKSDTSGRYQKKVRKVLEKWSGSAPAE